MNLLTPRKHPIFVRLLAAILALSSLPLSPQPGRVSYSQAATTISYTDDLTLDTPVTVFLTYDSSRGSREVTYRFIPEETCQYTFFSISDEATACYLRGSSGTTINYDYGHQGRRENFSLTTSLTKGAVYYFTAQYSQSTSMEGSFQICLTRTVTADTLQSAAPIGISPKGVEQSIEAANRPVYLTFTPETTGYYAIYQLPSCQCSGQTHETDCTYLQDLCLTVSKQGKTGSLTRIAYSTSEDKPHGVLVYRKFEQDTTYYIEVSALDYVSTGTFRIGISQDLADVPLDDSGEDTYAFTLEDSTEALLLRTVIPAGAATGSAVSGLTLTVSDSYYIAADVLDEDGTVVASRSMQEYLDLAEALEPGVYYIRLSCFQDVVKHFSLTMSHQVVLATPAPTDAPSEAPSSAPSAAPDGTALPGTSDSSSSSADPAASAQPSGSAAPDEDTAAETQRSIEDASLTKLKNQTYTGKAIRPAIRLTMDGQTLTVGTDFTVSYRKNKKIGTAKVTIQGAGVYTGTRTASFRIVPAAPKISLAQRDGSRISLKWKKVRKATGYEIQYAYNKKFKKAKKYKTGKSAMTLTVTDGKPCYVRVRAYTTVKKKTFSSAFRKKTLK